MILYGASGHGKVVFNCLKNNGIGQIMICDDDAEKLAFMGLSVHHGYNPKMLPEEKMIISIGDNMIRKYIAGKVKHAFGNCAHASSVIANTAMIAEGTVIFHLAIIQSNVKVGKHCIVNTGAIIEHESVLEDFVHISPAATICGNVTIGEGTHIGAGAIVIPNKKIGKWCKIAAGAIIHEDVPDFSLVAGVPAKVIKNLGTQI